MKPQPTMKTSSTIHTPTPQEVSHDWLLQQLRGEIGFEMNQTQLANKYGTTPATMAQVLHGRQQILEQLGYRKQVTYVKID